MKKDFSQLFQQVNTHAYLILEDNVSHRFVLFVSKEDIDEYGEESAFRTLHLDLDENHPIALQLTKYVATKGFALSSIRELVRETEITYSFIDSTPGRERDVVAIHAHADITDKTMFQQGDAQLVSLEKYADCMQTSLFGSKELNLGITQILLEKSDRTKPSS